MNNNKLIGRQLAALEHTQEDYTLDGILHIIQMGTGMPGVDMKGFAVEFLFRSEERILLVEAAEANGMTPPVPTQNLRDRYKNMRNKITAVIDPAEVEQLLQLQRNGTPKFNPDGTHL